MRLLAGLAVAVAAAWGLLVAVLWRIRPDDLTVRQALRLLPDLLRLIRRLAADPRIPARRRVVLWLLLAYLAVPFDLVPDFLPVIGHADDAVVVIAALRAVGEEAIRRNWPGSPEGLAAVLALGGVKRGGRGRRRTTR